MVFTSDLFHQYTTNVRDRELIWMVWSIRLLILNVRRDLVYFDLFLYNIVEIMIWHNEVSSLSLNRFLKVFFLFYRKMMHGNCLVCNRIMCLNALSFALVLYWLNGVDANTIVKRYYFDYFVGCCSLVLFWQSLRR